MVRPDHTVDTFTFERNGCISSSRLKLLAEFPADWVIRHDVNQGEIMDITVLGLPSNLEVGMAKVLRQSIIEAVENYRSVPENTGHTFCIFPVCHGAGEQIILEVAVDRSDYDELQPDFPTEDEKEDFVKGLETAVLKFFPNAHVGCRLKAHTAYWCD